ncbi:hypothetical protein [Armatimonas sp.]|uniref:hypothetical protein n=1 Tax=Armatimonas sp. TaxID=1872638 RepID=UPI00286B2031|nr:hypothetical protein [Armatimonas sp.]
MPDPNIPTPAPTVPTTLPTTVTAATKRKRAAQDQALANFFTTALTRLHAAAADPVLEPFLTRRTIKPAVLAEGIALGTTLQSRFTDRQRKEEADDKGLAAIADTRKSARAGFTLYRETVRLAYPSDTAARAALGATGSVPPDDDTFLSTATAAYAIAADLAHAATLANAGFGASEHAAALATLSAFAAARTAYPAVHAATLQATADRDSAAAVFKTWMATYNRAARLIVKEHPELAARLL